jgi:hypothetical protein
MQEQERLAGPAAHDADPAASDGLEAFTVWQGQPPGGHYR